MLECSASDNTGSIAGCMCQHTTESSGHANYRGEAKKGLLRTIRLHKPGQENQSLAQILKHFIEVLKRCRPTLVKFTSAKTKPLTFHVTSKVLPFELCNGHISILLSVVALQELRRPQNFRFTSRISKSFEEKLRPFHISNKLKVTKCLFTS